MLAFLSKPFRSASSTLSPQSKSPSLEPQLSAKAAGKQRSTDMDHMDYSDEIPMSDCRTQVTPVAPPISVPSIIVPRASSTGLPRRQPPHKSRESTPTSLDGEKRVTRSRAPLTSGNVASSSNVPLPEPQGTFPQSHSHISINFTNIDMDQFDLFAVSEQTTHLRQALIETPDFQRLAPDALPRVRLNAALDSMTDDSFLKRHKFPEKLEKRSKKQEHDRLVHERHKLRSTLEVLRSTTGSENLANIVRSAGLGLAIPNLSLMVAGAGRGERSKEWFKVRDELLKEAEETLARYDQLLEPRKPLTTGGKNKMAVPQPEEVEAATAATKPQRWTVPSPPPKKRASTDENGMKVMYHDPTSGKFTTKDNPNAQKILVPNVTSRKRRRLDDDDGDSGSSETDDEDEDEEMEEAGPSWIKKPTMVHSFTRGTTTSTINDAGRRSGRTITAFGQRLPPALEELKEFGLDWQLGTSEMSDWISDRERRREWERENNGGQRQSIKIKVSLKSKPQEP